MDSVQRQASFMQSEWGLLCSTNLCDICWEWAKKEQNTASYHAWNDICPHCGFDIHEPSLGCGGVINRGYGACRNHTLRHHRKKISNNVASWSDIV
jgi:hypothetical protein